MSAEMRTRIGLPLTGRHAIRPPVLQPVDDLEAPEVVRVADRGDITLEHCAVTVDEQAVALEYNVVGWGGTTVPPQAGLAVYVQGADGTPAAVRVYDDVDPAAASVRPA
jgi:hypothetical protein